MLEQTDTTLKNSDVRLCDETRPESLALIIIPTFNEAENIARLLNRLSELYQSDADILVIDDNSPDGTIDIVRSMQPGIRGLSVIKREKKLPVTIGLQMVLLPQFADQIIPVARIGKETGVDYTVIKHCTYKVLCRI